LYNASAPSENSIENTFLLRHPAVIHAYPERDS
jgi:hypothetical protein